MSTGANEAEGQTGSDIRQQLEDRIAENDHLIAEISKAFTQCFKESNAASFMEKCPRGIPSCLWVELESQMKEDGSLVEFYALSRAHFCGLLGHYLETRKHPNFPLARESVKSHFEADRKEIAELSAKWDAEYSDRDVIEGKLSDRVHKKFLRLQKRRNPAWFTELQVLRGASIESSIVGLWLPLGLWLYNSRDACAILTAKRGGALIPFCYQAPPGSQSPFGKFTERMGKLPQIQKISPHHIDAAVERHGLFRQKQGLWKRRLTGLPIRKNCVVLPLQKP
jgi:hypothetical protein